DDDPEADIEEAVAAVVDSDVFLECEEDGSGDEKADA
ncbi:hypothetical protein A2U01_0071709, partial [Trifolium medium]|nr:hypothetical protein [Trifolium medium]